MANNFNIQGADQYVSKSGNDANPGTADLPKLTISAALTAAPVGGDVVVGPGFWSEDLISLGILKNIIGDGGWRQVILDFTTATDLQRFRSLKGVTCQNLNLQTLQTFSESSDVVFHNIGRLNTTSGGDFNRCVIKNCNMVSGYMSGALVRNCTFYDNNMSAVNALAAASVRNSIFARQSVNTVNWNEVSAVDWDFNVWDNSITSLDGFANLAALQAARPAQHQNSITGFVSAADFQDIDNDDITLTAGSIAINSGDDGLQSGVRFESVAYGENADPSWTGWTLTNFTNNAGRLEPTNPLLPSSADSGLIDLSGLQNPVGRVIINGIENLPTEVIDDANAVNTPNHHCYLLSVDNVTFYRQINGVVPMFDPVNMAGTGDDAYNPSLGVPISASGIYIQIKTIVNGAEF